MSSNIFSCGLVVAIFSIVPVAQAQTVDNTVDELVQGLGTSHPGTIRKCIRALCEKQESGEDISQAQDALRTFVKAHVDANSPIGVTNDAKDTLLCLVRMGDPDATNHFLIALDLYLRRTGNARMHYFEEFVEAIQPSDQWDAYSVILRQYQNQFLDDDAGNISAQQDGWLLYHLTRFADDKQPIVAQLNARVAALNDPNKLRYYLPVVVVLADQPDLLPGIVTSTDRLFPENTVHYDEVGLVAAIAPFQPEAMALLAKWFANPEMKNEHVRCITFYVDSASRLKSPEREQAFGRLRAAASKAYDAVKPFEPDNHYDPNILESEKELISMIAVAFGESTVETSDEPSGLLDVNQYNDSQEMDLSKGLGSDF